MAVRQHATRLAAVCVMLGGLVTAGASPAAAASDSVRVRAADSFTAGGSAGAVTVEVRRRGEGCVLVRSTLGLRLAGLAANQVTVQFAAGGRWWPVPTGGGGGAVTTQHVSPANPTLCKGKSLTLRYRVALQAGVPAGRMTLVGEVTAARGHLLGRAATAARVVASRRTPSPSPTPTREPSPFPTTVAPTEPAGVEAEPTLAAVGGQPGAGTPVAAEQGSGGMSWFMLLGVGLVVVGAGLIVLLVRRSRAEADPADGKHAQSGVPLPRSPGGTTYRAGAGATTTSYAGGGAPSGGVYGRPAGPPSGSVYGSRPNAPTAPPNASTPFSPGHGTGPGGGTVYPSGPGQSGPPTSSGGGDATRVMPRLPD